MSKYLYDYSAVEDAMGDWLADNCDHDASLTGIACDCVDRFWDMVRDAEEERAEAIAESRAEMMADPDYWDYLNY